MFSVVFSRDFFIMIVSWSATMCSTYWTILSIFKSCWGEVSKKRSSFGQRIWTQIGAWGPITLSVANITHMRAYFSELQLTERHRRVACASLVFSDLKNKHRK
jgi:hypothetical protein